MEYKVSEKIQKKFDTLTKDAKVQKALQFMEDDQNEIIDRQIELTLIPAPTNHEQKKAARLLEMFKEEGLTDCHIDEYQMPGNCGRYERMCDRPVYDPCFKCGRN